MRSKKVVRLIMIVIALWLGYFVGQGLGYTSYRLLTGRTVNTLSYMWESRWYSAVGASIFAMVLGTVLLRQMTADHAPKARK